MAGTPPPQTLEQRIVAIEKLVIPTVAANTPKISTKLAAILSTGAAVGSYLLTGTLPAWAHILVTAIVTAIVSFEAAENT